MPVLCKWSKTNFYKNICRFKKNKVAVDSKNLYKKKKKKVVLEKKKKGTSIKLIPL